MTGTFVKKTIFTELLLKVRTPVSFRSRPSKSLVSRQEWKSLWLPTNRLFAKQLEAKKFAYEKERN